MTSATAQCYMPPGLMSEQARLMYESRLGQFQRRQAQQEDLDNKRGQVYQTGLPMAAAGAAGAYGLYRLQGEESRILNQIIRLVKHRDMANRAIDWILKLKNAEFGRHAIRPESVEALGRLQLAIRLGEPPDRVKKALGHFYGQNQGLGMAKSVKINVERYLKTYRIVAKDTSGLKKICQPILTNPMGLRTWEARTLISRNPFAFMKKLLGLGIRDTRFGDKFFKRLFQEFSKANKLIAAVVAGSVAFTVLGTFMTIWETAKQRSHQ